MAPAALAVAFAPPRTARAGRAGEQLGGLLRQSPQCVTGRRNTYYNVAAAHNANQRLCILAVDVCAAVIDMAHMGRGGHHLVQPHSVRSGNARAKTQAAAWPSLP